jgi:hypothetical protein
LGSVRIYRAHGRDQRLGQHLAAKYTLDPFRRGDTAKDIFLDFFQIEQRQEPGKRGIRHFDPRQETYPIVIAIYKNFVPPGARGHLKQTTEKLSGIEKCNIGPLRFAAVARVSQGGNKTLEIGRLSAAKQHLAWRHFRSPPL